MKTAVWIAIACALCLATACEPIVGTVPGDGDEGTPELEFTGITYRYELDGTTVNYIADYNFEEVSRSVGPGEEIVAASEVPGLGTVIETDAGNYYMEGASDFDQIALPVGVSELHIHQMVVRGSTLYFGADNNIFVAPNLDADFTDGVAVMDNSVQHTTPNGNKTYFEQTFVSTASGTMATNLHFFPSGSDLFVWMGDDVNTFDSGLFEIGHRYTDPGSGYEWVEFFEASSIEDKLHTTYVYQTDSDFRNLEGGVLTIDSIGTVSGGLGSYVNGYQQFAGFGQNDLVDENRYLLSLVNGRFVSRDTMFHPYWERQVYCGGHSERQLLGFSVTGSTITVEVMSLTSDSLTGVGSFDVEAESFGGEPVLPNMWLDTDDTVWVAVNDTVYQYDANGVELDTVQFSGRIDSFTILPSGNLIAMDLNGTWYSADGSAYNGDNVIAQY